MMISKIADRHLSREACIYIRQSTMGQVRFNQESTERQYNLAGKAQSLGWSPERIRILDRDLGVIRPAKLTPYRLVCWAACFRTKQVVGDADRGDDCADTTRALHQGQDDQGDRT